MTTDTSDESDRLALARLSAANQWLRDEVARLTAALAESRARPCPYVTGRTTQYCTLTPLTLTDSERKALETAVRMAGDPSPITAPQVFEYAATLRGLLERLK